jgi:hypothetical protein
MRLAAWTLAAAVAITALAWYDIIYLGSWLSYPGLFVMWFLDAAGGGFVKRLSFSAFLWSGCAGNVLAWWLLLYLAALAMAKVARYGHTRHESA